MGLSIHYSGYILDKKMLDHLIEEVTDIGKALDWSTHIFDDKEIKGISFAPKGSEPVFLTFNREERMLSPISIINRDIYNGRLFNKELMFTASTKTQFAGPNVHIAIIKLLKYLSKKYLKDFTLTDEGYYWETGDEKILMEQFEKYETGIDILFEAIKNLPVIPGETQESLAERLERMLKEKLKREE